VSTLILDQSDWGTIRVTGADRARFLHGMCTADVEGLADGDWARGCMLNVKGRVLSVIDIVNRGDHLLVICAAELADKTQELLDKHAIMDDVEFERVQVAVHRVWDSVDAVWSAPPVFAPAPSASATDEIEIRRVEAGLPAYGSDVNEDYFPFESLLGTLIDYEKGCYIGQEPVYRVYSKGAANKTMRGLVFAGDVLPAVGAVVAHPDRAKAGTVTSAVRSPKHGVIALAYLHRKVADTGQDVDVDGQSARVVELPFSADSVAG